MVVIVDEDGVDEVNCVLECDYDLVRITSRTGKNDVMVNGCVL